MLVLQIFIGTPIDQHGPIGPVGPIGLTVKHFNTYSYYYCNYSYYYCHSYIHIREDF